MTDRTQQEARRLARHIAEVVAEAPPLTPGQRDRLAGLLRPAVLRESDLGSALVDAEPMIEHDDVAFAERL